MGAIPRKTMRERLGLSLTDNNKDLQRLKDLLTRCLNLDADKRLTVEEAIRHKFFESARVRRGYGQKGKNNKSKSK